jgi:hypothetical protein
MTVLYENRARAKRARLSILGAVVWSIGWFYWAHVLSGGGAQSGAIAIVIGVGLLPLVVLHFYCNAYVVRLAREDDEVAITTLGLIGNRLLRLPPRAVTEVTRPEAGGIIVRVAGRRMPLLMDLQAEHVDIEAISALGGRESKKD